MSRQSTPILMIHGAFCGAWAFEKFRTPFEAAGFEVAALTLRHHERGADLRALGRTSLSDYASDIGKAIDALESPPILIGHSLGGLLAQMIATRKDIRAAVLLAPCAPWGLMPTTLFEMASAQTMFLAGDYWNTPLKPDYSIAAAHSLNRLPRGERHAVFERFVPESGLATFEILHWGMDFKRASHVPARKVTCPILCLTGSEDRINPPSTVKRIAERYQGRAVFDELEGFSHWPIGEPGWENVAARALAWIGETLGKTPEAARA